MMWQQENIGRNALLRDKILKALKKKKKKKKKNNNKKKKSA